MDGLQLLGLAALRHATHGVAAPLAAALVVALLELAWLLPRLPRDAEGRVL